MEAYERLDAPRGAVLDGFNRERFMTG